jgi:hypothetical protein
MSGNEITNYCTQLIFDFISCWPPNPHQRMLVFFLSLRETEGVQVKQAVSITVYSLHPIKKFVLDMF